METSAIWLWAPSLFRDRELILSVESVRKHCPWVKQYLVLSMVDPKIEGVKWIQPSILGTSKNTLLFNMFTSVVEQLPEKWMVMNDDWHFLVDVSEKELEIPFADGYEPNRDLTKYENTFDQMLNAALAVAREVDDCCVNFCAHAPWLITKEKFKARLVERPEFYGQLETHFLAETDVQYRLADSFRAFWCSEPKGTIDLYRSVFDAGRKMICHDDTPFNNDCPYMWEFLEECLKYK